MRKRTASSMGWLNHFQGLKVWGEWKAWDWRDGVKIRREEEWPERLGARE